jgi:hypothetical protein
MSARPYAWKHDGPGRKRRLLRLRRPDWQDQRNAEDCEGHANERSRHLENLPGFRSPRNPLKHWRAGLATSISPVDFFGGILATRPNPPGFVA